MSEAGSANNPARSNVHTHLLAASISLSDAFLAGLVAELDGADVTSIALRGSYARGEATAFSDIDISRCMREEATVSIPAGQFFYRKGHLVSLSTRKIALYRERMLVPEQAIYTVPALREARILLDKHGDFYRLQQAARNFTWEPLQESANAYASQHMLLQTEIVHKILRALHLHDILALTEMIQLLFAALTNAVAVQRGLLLEGGNTYFRQVQQAVGLASHWVYCHNIIADLCTPPVSLAEKGVAALRLYQETALLLRDALRENERPVVEQTCAIIGEFAPAGEQAADALTNGPA